MLSTAPGKTALRIFLLTLPVIIYVSLIHRYAYNFPFLDDYDTVLSHVLLPLDDQVQNWFAPHNEHNHLILKIAATGDTLFFGQINLVRLVWIGAVFFIVFYVLLLRQARESGLDWIWLTPLSLLLFQPSYWGTMTWATTALHNFPGLLFAFLSCFLWRKRRPLALLFTVLALLTNGYGIAVLGSLLLWVVFENFVKRRNKSFLADSYISLIPLTLILAGWILFRIWQSELVLLTAFQMVDPLNAIHFLTNFLGSCIHFLGSPWVTLLAIGQILLFIWLIKSGIAREHPEWMFFLVYLFLAATMATWGRSTLGPSQGLASRYRIYSTMIVCVLYLGSALSFGNYWKVRAWVSPALLTIACLFFSSSIFVNVNNLGKIRSRLEADKTRWTSGEAIREYPVPEHAERVLREAAEASLFYQRNP